jgi:hypothetical protein
MDLKDLEDAYTAASIGKVEPTVMYAPEGCFVKQDDGSVVVYDFDGEGNHVALPSDQQELRKQALKDRLSKWEESI